MVNTLELLLTTDFVGYFKTTALPTVLEFAAFERISVPNSAEMRVIAHYMK